VHYEEILITLEGLHFGGSLELNFYVASPRATGEACNAKWVWVPTRDLYVHIKHEFVPQRIHSVSIRKVKRLILCREIICIYWKKYEYMQHESVCIL
jgi:hypothetical protein